MPCTTLIIEAAPEPEATAWLDEYGLTKVNEGVCSSYLNGDCKAPLADVDNFNVGVLSKVTIEGARLNFTLNFTVSGPDGSKPGQRSFTKDIGTYTGLCVSLPMAYRSGTYTITNAAISNVTRA